jgi:hypothetical protein
MNRIPASIAVLGALVCLFFWAHIALALILRFMARTDKQLVDKLFASPPLGGMLPFGPYMMRVKLFFPWVTVNGVSGHSSSLTAMMWSARLAGSAWLVSFSCLIGDFVYLASTG